MNRSTEFAVWQEYEVKKFYHAVRKLEIQRVSDLVNENPFLVNSYYQRTRPLHIAIRRRCLSLVELLVQRGADLEGDGEDGARPLHQALQYGNSQTIKFLLQCPLDINARDHGYFATPAMITAVRYTNVEIVHLLLTAAADVNQCSALTTALITAAQIKNEEMLKLLLRHRADVHARDERGATVLHHACGANCIELLVAAGADLGSVTEFGETPLHYAAKTGDYAAARAFLNVGIDVFARESEYNLTAYECALYASAHYYNSELVGLLRDVTPVSG